MLTSSVNSGCSANQQIISVCLQCRKDCESHRISKTSHDYPMCHLLVKVTRKEKVGRSREGKSKEVRVQTNLPHPGGSLRWDSPREPV